MGVAREAASLREAPPSRSLPKSGWRLRCAILRSWFRLSVGAVPCCLCESTAADRAAADVRRGGVYEKIRWWMPSDFSCLGCVGMFPWLPPQREPFGGTSRKASPERGGARHRRAEGFVSHTPHGRGGSVSRRDHNPKTRNRAHAAWAHKSEGAVKPIPSYSSGERGLGGEALLLEKRPLPPVRPLSRLFGRGGPGEGASLREASSPGVSLTSRNTC